MDSEHEWDTQFMLLSIALVKIVIWIYDTFYHNLGIENDFTKYLESCL